MLKQYDGFVTSLSLTNADNLSIAAERYIKLFNTAPIEIRDSGFVIFNKFYEKLALKLDDLPEKETMDLDKYYAYADSVEIPDSIVNYVKHLKQDGFDLREEEGSMYIVEDRDFIVSRFYDVVSPVMKQYLIQVNKENKNIYAEDASIIIGYKELVDRAIWWEHFAKNHPAFACEQQARNQNMIYLELLLEGMDNTWVIQPETKKLEAYFEKAYSYLERTYPLSETGKIVMPYFHYLANQQNIKADSLLKDYNRKGIINQSLSDE